MTGRSEPPDGAPENPAGGEDEYRSLVFDESFVQAARMQEYSAQERMGEHAHAVRAVPDAQVSVRSGGGSRAAIALVVLIALAFAVAVYIGFRSPYPQPAARRAEPLRTTVVPLAPVASYRAGHPNSCTGPSRSPDSVRARQASTTPPWSAHRTSPTARSPPLSPRSRTTWWSRP